MFLDAHGELCVRTFGSSGTMRTLRAGTAGGAYHYGEPTYVGCEIGIQGDDVFVNVGSLGWELPTLFRRAEGPKFDDRIHFVVGSDNCGRSPASLRTMEVTLVANVPSNENRHGVREYVGHKLACGYERAVEYEPGTFLHTVGHPNFPANAPTGPNGLVTFGPRPRLRKLA